MGLEALSNSNFCCPRFATIISQHKNNPIQREGSAVMLKRTKPVQGPSPGTPTRPSREPLVLALVVIVSSLVLVFFDSKPLSSNFVYPLLSSAAVLLIWAVVGTRCAVLFARFARRRLWRRSVDFSC